MNTKTQNKTKHIDLLVHAGWVATVSEHSSNTDVQVNHSVAVHQGKILGILPTAQAKQRYTADSELNRSHHLVTPGLVNAHGHAAMSLMRGMADDIPLNTWLEEHIWPTEGEYVTESFVSQGTDLAIAEMIRSGTTCFSDMYFFPDVVARQARQAGIRACVGLILLDFPTIWAKNADEYISKGLALYDELKTDALINAIFAPHAPYTVSDEPLIKIRSLAAELGIPTQMHVHETAFEVQNALEQTQIRPLHRLNELGLLSPDFMAVHMTQLNEDDLALVKATGTHVIHCPESNMKLASGICPVNTLQKMGVNVALGTDGAASNNDLNMLGEMRSAAMLAKISNLDATAVNARTALRMATLNGAKALGIGHITGSLDKGKAADMISIDLHHLNTSPVYDPISQLVYAANSEQICDVWVNGQPLMQEHKLTGFNEQHLIHNAQQWRDKIINTPSK